MKKAQSRHASDSTRWLLRRHGWLDNLKSLCIICCGDRGPTRMLDRRGKISETCGCAVCQELMWKVV